MYFSSSEFVSSGHPDRVADNLAAIVINDIQKKDGANSHAAIEVFLTHDTVIFSGEATTTLKINRRYLKNVVKKGFEMSGYLPEMRKYWSKKEVALAKDMKIKNNIFAQSPDIALGTTDKGKESGFNDQGIYFSSADITTPCKIGFPMYVAQLISRALSEESRSSILDQDVRYKLGPDNKVVVTCSVANDGYTPIEVTDITIAVAHNSDYPTEALRQNIKTLLKNMFRVWNVKVSEHCNWVINGTGRFVVHGCISDTSMTGRKISVNHPSAGPLWSNKLIGGGSLVKPWHASDLILNLASRFIANHLVAAGITKYAVVGCAGAIGQQGIQSIFIKGDYKFETSKKKTDIVNYFLNNMEWKPYRLATLLGLFDNTFDFAEAVDNNFFGSPAYQPWEFVRSHIVDDLRKIWEC